MKVPELTPVQSTNLQALGFADGLFVRFLSGQVFYYHDVPESLYDHGMKSESKGKWFAKEVRGHYKGVPVDAEPQPH